MKFIYVVLIAVFLSLFTLLNYYIGTRGWRAFGYIFPPQSSKIYWAAFWFLVFSYLLGRLGEYFLPRFIDNFLTFIGSYWLAAMFYFLIIMAVFDIILIVGRYTSLIPFEVSKKTGFQFITSSGMILVVVLILVYGTWNANNPDIVTYNIDISKKAGQLKGLNIVMVSDIHLGNIVDNKRLLNMVERINELKPDIVLLAGDVIDERVEPFTNQKMGNTFKKLQTKYGVYSVLGNHEYIGGSGEEAVEVLEDAGIKVLRDGFIKIDDAFYIVGRNDLSSKRFTGKERMDLKNLLSDINIDFPVILMDHQPVELDKAEQNGVDLQLSGHTHRGQLFPSQLITRRIFDIDWGYLKHGSLNTVVSSGFGTWGPPIRIGSRSEIVNIILHFIP